MDSHPRFPILTAKRPGDVPPRNVPRIARVYHYSLMKRPIRGPWAAALLFVLQLTVPCVHGQAGAAGQQTPPAPAPPPLPPPTITEKVAPPQRRWSIGLRARTLPFKSLSVIGNNQILRTSTVNKVVYDFSYNTSSQSFIPGYGPTIEVPLGNRFLLTVEALFNRLKYTKVTDTYWGGDDPTTAHDERSHMVATENTKARLFDIPVLLHYGRMRPSGVLARFYVAAGATARLASTVRTTNSITNADGTTAANSVPAQLSKRNLLGATVAVGFRFIDDFNIKVTPEVRYTHWTGMTFGQDSTQSPKNQLEVGIGFSR